LFFFFQVEDGIRDRKLTGVQTCALPIYEIDLDFTAVSGVDGAGGVDDGKARTRGEPGPRVDEPDGPRRQGDGDACADQGALARKIGRASSRERARAAHGGSVINTRPKRR